MMSAIPEPKGWHDDWQLAFPSKYIGAQHLRGKEVTMTISRVELPELEMVREGSKPEKKRKLVLSFKELEGRPDPTQWICNKTNARIIAALHGKACRAWVGKRITMYTAQVQSFGKIVDAVRIKPTRVPSADGSGRVEPSSPPMGSPPAAGGDTEE